MEESLPKSAVICQHSCLCLQLFEDLGYKYLKEILQTLLPLPLQQGRVGAARNAMQLFPLISSRPYLPNGEDLPNTNIRQAEDTISVASYVMDSVMARNTTTVYLLLLLLSSTITDVAAFMPSLISRISGDQDLGLAPSLG